MRQGKENMRLELCLWTLLCAGAMAVMLAFAANKTIVIADVPSDLAGAPDSPEDEPAQANVLTLQETFDEKGIFYIPLPKGVKAESVMVENHYIHKELWLRIKCEDTVFFEENALTGDTGHIQEGSYVIQEDGVQLRLKMRRVMEYRSVLEGNMLAVVCYEPGELYDYVVVLDPAAGESDAEAAGMAQTAEEPAQAADGQTQTSEEPAQAADGQTQTAEEPARAADGQTQTADGQVRAADVALSVARMVQKKLSLEGVRIYLTRAEGTKLSEEDRLALTEQVGADLYIGIDVLKDETDPDRYGILCYYNQDYFIPDFGNVQLADILARETAIASSNRALGLEPAERGSLLEHMEIPAAQLSVGYLSNLQEKELLAQESYQEKLAEGILTALAKACRELEHVRAVRAAE